MTTAIEYALMADRAYYDTRADKNRFPIPAGWEGLKHESAPNSGFEVISFVPIGATLTTSTEIVISFAGTGPGWADWIHGNTPLALGNICVQLKQAADYYLQVRANNPGATISFTGHSLGGGLASLMAVFFGESAVTFSN